MKENNTSVVIRLNSDFNPLNILKWHKKEMMLKDINIYEKCLRRTWLINCQFRHAIIFTIFLIFDCSIVYILVVLSISLISIIYLSVMHILFLFQNNHVLQVKGT